MQIHSFLMISIMLVLSGLYGCSNDNEAQKLLMLSELKDKEITRDASYDEIRRIKDEIAGLKQLYNINLNDLKELGVDVSAYKRANIFKTGAISLAEGSLEKLSNPNSSDSDRNVAAIGGILTAIAFYNDPVGTLDYVNEVSAAENKQAELEARLQELAAEIAQYNADLEPKQKAFDHLNNTIQALRTKISAF